MYEVFKWKINRVNWWAILYTNVSPYQELGEKDLSTKWAITPYLKISNRNCMDAGSFPVRRRYSCEIYLAMFSHMFHNSMYRLHLIITHQLILRSTRWENTQNVYFLRDEVKSAFSTLAQSCQQRRISLSPYSNLLSSQQYWY